MLPGKDSIQGINFRVKHDKPLGPGSYAHPDEIENMRKVKRQLSHNAPPNIAFGAVAPRAKGDFHQQALKERAYQGVVGQYHTDKGFAKNTFNYALSPHATRTNRLSHR